MTRKILLGALVALIVIQFFPIDKANPSSDPSHHLAAMEQLSDSEMASLKAACMDCHGNNTVYPAYTRFQPVGWFVRGHIKSGRQKVNFSEWQQYTDKQKNHKLEECVEVLEENRMPMKSYTWLHPPAKLSDGQKAELVALFKRLQS